MDHISEEKALDPTNVFVKYLPSYIDDGELNVLFSTFGSIVSAKVMVDPQSWKSLGYGFVRFSTKEEAQWAISTMTGHRIDNKTLFCKISNIFVFATPSPNLYIKPLPFDFTEDILRAMFGGFGRIQTLKIVRDEEKPVDVVGLVQYPDDIESATRAIQSRNGTKLANNWPLLIVKYAETDIQRATRKANISPPPRRKQQVNRDQRTDLVPQSGFVPPSYYHSNDRLYYYQQPYVVTYAYALAQEPLPSTPTGWYNSSNNVVYPSYVR